MTMDAIRKDEANLLTAEGSFEVLFYELDRINLSLRLGSGIGKRTQPTSQAFNQHNAANLDRTIKLACENYAATNVMHPFPKQIFDALPLIKPTSIKNEQNFSMSSNFLAKNCKQMNWKTLDDLCLLKSFLFLDQNNDLNQ